MKIGFYYHIPLVLEQGRIKAPAYLGVFLDALAGESEHLYLVMHEATGSQINEADYYLVQPNITWINLGAKTPAWHRVLFHRSILKSKLSEVEECDIMLVRSPSPLASFFDRYLTRPTVCFMIVGDYTEGLNNMKNDGFRQFIVKGLLVYISWLFERKIKGSEIIVNSPRLHNKYKGIAKAIGIIKTTTLSNSDFFERNDTCNNSKIEILFTGRIDPAKGLFELIEAVSGLRKEGFIVTLNIVGIEVPSSAKVSVKEELVNRSKELQIEDYVIFHGWKSVGEDLNRMYRAADIYVIPSYHEGFPRTIWEALANSLPVIATNVGAIPTFLKKDESAIIIQPKDSNAIKDSIIRLIQDEYLRKKLICNGLILAREVTQEKQILVLIDFLKGITLNKKRKNGNKYVYRKI